MDIRNRQGLKQAAASRLSQAQYSPRKLVLIHSGISLGAAVLISVLHYIITWQIDSNAGGLSGMQLRSMLETAASVLQSAYTIVSPFWQLGITYAVLCIARGRYAGPGDLLEGFRRFGPVLRLRLLQIVLYAVIAIPCVYAAAIIFSVTPWAQPLMELAMTDAAAAMDVQSILSSLSDAQMLQITVSIMVIFLVLYLAVLIPISYRFRMADLLIMDKPGTGAFQAMRESSRLTKGSRFQLFRLDLSFWVYYVLQVPIMLLAYADVLLPALGVTLPFSETVAYFLFYILYALAQLALNCWMYAHVATTQAVAYEALHEKAQQPPVPKPAPKNLPWDDTMQ